MDKRNKNLRFEISEIQIGGNLRGVDRRLNKKRTGFPLSRE